MDTRIQIQYVILVFKEDSDQFLELLAWFEAWRKWFVVGKVVLPLRFDLSQALCVCLVVFQVCKRVLAVLV